MASGRPSRWERRLITTTALDERKQMPWSTARRPCESGSCSCAASFCSGASPLWLLPLYTPPVGCTDARPFLLQPLIRRPAWAFSVPARLLPPAYTSSACLPACPPACLPANIVPARPLCSATLLPSASSLPLSLRAHACWCSIHSRMRRTSQGVVPHLYPPIFDVSSTAFPATCS